MMDEIPRETPNEKIEGLTEYSEQLFDEMEHLSFLND